MANEKLMQADGPGEADTGVQEAAPGEDGTGVQDEPEAVPGVELVGEEFELSAETFDLAAYLAEGTLEFPKYKGTVYMDAVTASAISDILEDKAKNEKALATARARQKLEANRNAGSLAGAQTPNRDAEIADLEAKAQELEAKHRELDAKFQRSKLTLYFQLPEPANEITKKVQAEVKKRYPNAPAPTSAKALQDPAYLFWGRYQMLLMLSEVCDWQGRKASAKPTMEQLDYLLDHMPQSENEKLSTASGLAFSGGDQIQRAVDAGFPG